MSHNVRQLVWVYHLGEAEQCASNHNDIWCLTWVNSQTSRYNHRLSLLYDTARVWLLLMRSILSI